MSKISLLSILLITFLFIGCTGQQVATDVPKGILYTKIYKSKPKSVLVLPALNTTTSANATDVYGYTISKVLSEKGYYVFPPMLVDKFFKSENISDAELIRKIPISKLNEVFDCDAVLYVDIKSWDTKAMPLIGSSVEVILTYTLVDAKTGDILMQKYTSVKSSKSMSFGSITGLIASAIDVALNASIDYHTLSIMANTNAFENIPYGYYTGDEYYMNDISDTIPIYTSVKKIDAGKLYVNSVTTSKDTPSDKSSFVISGGTIVGEGLKTSSSDTLSMYNDPNGLIIINNLASEYYTTTLLNGVNVLRNRYFLYDLANEPFIIDHDKIIYVQYNTDGTIVVNKDSDGVYFNITKMLNTQDWILPSKEKSSKK